MKWFEKFAESLEKHAGEDVTMRVTEGLESVPLGSGKHAREERTLWIKSAMDRLEDLCDEETGNQVLIDTCPHTYPKTRIKKMRAAFRRVGDVDSLLEMMREDTSYRGGSYYDYPVREDKVIYVTKVPYNPDAYEAATTEEEKRLAYCHCPLVKGSDEEISATFCCCSGGWVKQLWEGVFEQSVEVELSESLLKGDNRCTHAVRIPDAFL
ncbi:hypothetical protein EU546_04255 [Candidatus Thorarchaeota archaeon]|nr:MAG: hypothetical protein EU546_04255 [Candidatus Thorarchaeota archaeon]